MLTLDIFLVCIVFAKVVSDGYLEEAVVQSKVTTARTRKGMLTTSIQHPTLLAIMLFGNVHEGILKEFGIDNGYLEILRFQLFS
jgi:hypothetical protein